MDKDHCLLLVKIHKALAENKTHYEATRGNWVVGAKWFESIRYVAGVHDGRIVCAFAPEKWEVVIDEKGKERKRFEGLEAPHDVLQLLQKVEGDLLPKFRNQNPIKYLPCPNLVE